MENEKSELSVPILYKGVNFFPNIEFSEENLFIVVNELFKFITKLLVVSNLTDTIDENTLNYYKKKFNLKELCIDKDYIKYYKTYFTGPTSHSNNNDIELYFARLSSSLGTRVHISPTSSYSDTVFWIPNFIINIPLFDIIDDELHLIEGYLVIEDMILLPNSVIKRNNCRLKTIETKTFNELDYKELMTNNNDFLNFKTNKKRLRIYSYSYKLLDKTKEITNYIRRECER